jgi:hypothetical protein
MQARPELISRSQFTGKRNKRNREIWTPNIIGKDYRIKRSGPAAGGERRLERPHALEAWPFAHSAAWTKQQLTQDDLDRAYADWGGSARACQCGSLLGEMVRLSW